MSACCHPPATPPASAFAAFRRDFLLLGSAAVLLAAVVTHVWAADFLATFPRLAEFAHGTTTFLGQIWWGVLLGILAAGVLANLPAGVVAGVLGRGGTLAGLARAAGAGVLLDLCSHGILLVGMQLYRQGASYGQVLAFLIASPWNSFSLTFVLWGLIGLPLTLGFIGLSLVVAVTSGLAAEWAVRRGYLLASPHAAALPADFSWQKSCKKVWQEARFSLPGFWRLLLRGFTESRMVLRWILFGAVLAGVVRAVLPLATFQNWFGPTLLGLAATLLAATALEVCSEGSVPLATDLVTRAAAPGNAFTFLMAGVATDYTEIAALRATTGSWRLAFFLPLVTLPQVLLLGWLLNNWAAV